MAEHTGIRKLALELGDMSFVDREAELSRALGPILDAANGLKVIKSVLDGDGDWQAITAHSINKLKAALERFNRGE